MLVSPFAMLGCCVRASADECGVDILGSGAESTYSAIRTRYYCVVLP